MMNSGFNVSFDSSFLLGLPVITLPLTPPRTTILVLATVPVLKPTILIALNFLEDS